MKLIADSGSTKTDWRLIGDDKPVISANTIGLNPYHNTTEDIQQALITELLPDLNCDPGEVSEIHFYGAGCSSKDKNRIVELALEAVFPKADLFVDHDLLGAARALCGNSPGIVAILGTGSNSCYYDGETILENSPALGYVLGDEGSGSYIGKQFIRNYLYNEIPLGLRAKFEEEYTITKDQVLHQIYKEALPNRYLASFTKWVGENLAEDYCKDLVERSFNDFFKHHITKYEQHQSVPMNVLGSVGISFKANLEEVGAKHQVKIGKVIKTPIEELVEYHRT